MLRKTTITLEILDNPKEGYNPNEMSIEQLAYAVTHGNMSGNRGTSTSVMLNIEDSIKETKAQGSDPDFFGIPEELTTEDIQNFLDEYGTEVQEHEKSDYVELMMDNHICIEFNKKQYYVGEDTNYGKKQFLYDIVESFYRL